MPLRTRPNRSHCLYAILVASAVSLAGCRSHPNSIPATTPSETFNRDLNLLSVDQLFKRISDTYYNPTRLQGDGIDWDSWHERVRLAVSDASTMDDVRQAMSEALDQLGESHFAVIPGDVFDNYQGDRFATVGATSVEPGSVGIHVRLVENEPVISSIDRGSSADAARVRAGWAIESIDGQDTIAEVEHLRTTFGNRPLSEVRIIEWVESKLLVPVNESVVLKLRSPRGEVRTLRLKSQRQPGLWASFGYLPAMNLRYAAARLNGDIGYFSLSVFLNPPQVMPVFGQFIRENQNARGLIIDLRGNPGGLGAMATGMCGFLIPEEGRRLGTMLRRDGNLQFVVNPRYPQFTGPVAVLIDGMSLSTSEILAGGLQDAGRAKLFGQQTPGAALPSTVTRLANGDVLQYVLADFVSANGQRLEGRGITPDVVVPLDRESLYAGRDDVLEAACRWITEGNRSPSTQESAPTTQQSAAEDAPAQ